MEVMEKKVNCPNCGKEVPLWSGGDSKGRSFESTVCPHCDTIHKRFPGGKWQLLAANMGVKERLKRFLGLLIVIFPMILASAIVAHDMFAR